jgi:hypothetical protein
MKKTLATLAILFAGMVSEAPAQSLLTLTNGQMVPCNHPLAVAEGRSCNAPAPSIIVTPQPTVTPIPQSAPPLTYTVQDPPKFRLGKSYFRASDGQRIHIAALGQTSAGLQMYYAECLNTAFSLRCPVEGAIWTLVANVSADGWTEEQ